MTELRERQHNELSGWAGESHLMRVVCAASALEENADYALLSAGASLEKDWQQYAHIIESDMLLSLRSLRHMPRVRQDRALVDALADAVKAYGDVVAAQLEMTSDQLYSMTFADFIEKHEQGRGSTEGEESTKKSLVERLNEAYDADAEQEDEEFFRTTKSYYRRRFHAED